MSRIVIPGVSGYLGRHLAARLVARGDEVTVLTRQPSTTTGGVRFVHWDATDVGDWADELNGAEAVVHLARQARGLPADPAQHR